MATIKEDYCSQEVYRLLKEKGFDGEIHTTFDGDGYTQPSITHQMAMKWLREVHFLFIDIDLLSGYEFSWSIWLMNEPNQKMGESLGVFSTYKEAAEAAIKYCLENLI